MEDEEFFSWELQDLLEEAINQLEIKKCYKLVEQSFNNYPKEKDSITMIVLQNINNSVYSAIPKTLIKFLMEYHDELLEKHLSALD